MIYPAWLNRSTVYTVGWVSFAVIVGDSMIAMVITMAGMQPTIIFEAL